MAPTDALVFDAKSHVFVGYSAVTSSGVQLVIAAAAEGTLAGVAMNNALIEADRQSLKRYGGHGSALVQAGSVLKSLRESLAAEFDLPRLEVVARQKSTDGTEKFLFKFQLKVSSSERSQIQTQSFTVYN